MIFIAHRGNIHGPNKKENNPDHIDQALSYGYDAEIDVWVLSNQIWLGHDGPTYKVDSMWLESRKDKLWCHAKNIEALVFLSDKKTNCFWHENDEYTLTSKGFIWTYPGNILLSNTKSIAVMPEIKPFDNSSMFYGFCSDYEDFFK